MTLLAPRPLLPPIPLQASAFEGMVGDVACCLDELCRSLPNPTHLAEVEAIAAVICHRLRQAPDGFKAWSAVRAALLLGLCRVNQQAASAPLTELCRRTARRALSGALADRVAGACWFHHSADTPAWTAGRVPVCEIGQLLFYR